MNFNSLLAFAVPMMEEMEDMKKKNDVKIEEILAEWRKTKTYPRKMKKKVRRRLQLDYSLFKWMGNHLDDFNLFNK